METNEKRATYVRLVYDETNFVTKVRQVEDRNLDNLELDYTVSSFYFFEMITFEREIDGKVVLFSSEEFNASERHFYGGKIITREDYLKRYPTSRIKEESEDEFFQARSKFGNIALLKKCQIFVPERKK